MRGEEDNEQKAPLARWVGVVQPAALSTTIGKQRFVVTIKLPDRSPKTVSSFMKEMKDALAVRELTTHFVLVDSERVRLQRATASFSTFKEAQSCLRVLMELGLPTNDVSPELEDFGSKKYDPWYESVSQAWWPWLAALRYPAPEMPMMKAKNRLDVGAGGKYAVGADGKLEKKNESDRGDAKEKPDKSDEVDRGDAQEDAKEGVAKKRKKKSRRDEGQDEEAPRRKKKRAKDGERKEG